MAKQFWASQGINQQFCSHRTLLSKARRCDNQYLPLNNLLIFPFVPWCTTNYKSNTYLPHCAILSSNSRGQFSCPSSISSTWYLIVCYHFYTAAYPNFKLYLQIFQFLQQNLHSRCRGFLPRCLIIWYNTSKRKLPLQVITVAFSSCKSFRPPSPAPPQIFVMGEFYGFRSATGSATASGIALYLYSTTSISILRNVRA